MKLLTSAIALATAAMATGCATYSDRPYMGIAATNPTVVVAEGDNNAMPYTTSSMFFKDRGLHFEDPSALTPKIVVAQPTRTTSPYN